MISIGKLDNAAPSHGLAAVLGVVALAAVVVVIVFASSRDQGNRAPAAAASPQPHVSAPAASPAAAVDAAIAIVQPATVVDAGAVVVTPDAAVARKRPVRPAGASRAAFTNSVELDEYGIAIQR